jgi:polysaccharide biosynthesis protein PslE
MSTAVGVPSSVVMRDLALALWFSRRRIFLITAVAIAIAGYAAFQVEPKYQAKSTLLVLLGPEHVVRPAAGQQMMNSFNVDPEQVFRTEADILDSDDLHRTVIEQIGLANLYPDLLKPPGPLAQMMTQARAYVTTYLGLKAGPGSDDTNLPMVQAERAFAQNFSVAVDKKSNIIQLSFQNPNRVLAAQALKSLEASYFDLRGKLFADRQASIVEANERQASDQLTAADRKLADFKRIHNVANFADRQKILMTEQGTLEDQLSKTESAIAGLQARLGNLAQQLRLASGQPNGKSVPNAASPLQGMVEAYRKRENEAQTTYRGSPAYDAARTEILKSEADIAKMRSTQAFTVSQEYNKTEADLHTNQATRGVIVAQLTDISNQLASINAEESQLHELERTRGVLEENYKAIAKIATDRKVIEDVDAHRQSSVRVVEAPRIPDKPVPIRMMILVGGAIAGLLVSVIVSLMSGFFRGVYLRPEALEADTGLTVLAVVPDQKLLANPVVLVTPR